MEKAIIYVAGNPDAYPVEYYDPQTELYQGVIPRLLRRFSQQSDYEVRYYAPGQRDQRRHLAQNRQVDMVTCLEGESFDNVKGDGVTVMAAEVDGEPVVYRLCLLKVAPADLEGALRDFMGQMSEEVRTGELIAAVESSPPSRQHRLETAAAALAVAAALMAGVILILICRFRRRLRRLEEDGESDPETGLGNRMFMARRVRQRLNDKNRVLYAMCCFYMDPNWLRSMEDGERVSFLQGMAAALQDFSSDTDIPARVSDNGFAVLRLCAERDEPVRWARGLMERIGADAPGGGACPVAAGIYPLKVEDRDLDNIVYRSLQTARTALERGESCMVCSDKAIASLAEEKRLQGDIRRGLNSGEFRMEIQFYVDAESGRIAGGEALPRWEHTEKGSVPPERFMPLAEREELTDELDAHHLEEACAFLENLRQQGIEDFFLCCRLSRNAAAGGDFARRCGQVVERYQFRRDRLILGLAESGMTIDPPAAGRNIREVKDMGLKIVLTGLGERLTPLFSLGDYPFDGLTIGRELVERAGSAAGPAVMGSMIRLGHELGISVLAEGVESVDQVRLLRSLSCDVMRGDQLYHAVPPWEARKKLLEQSKNLNSQP